MGQISCSSSSRADTAEISHVSGNALQSMSRTMAISTIAFAILDIHAKALLRHQLGCLATTFSVTISINDQKIFNEYFPYA